MAQCSQLSKIQPQFNDEPTNSNISDDMIKSITDDILLILQLEDNENKDQIVNDLLESGLQSLKKYADDIVLEIYEAEMSNNDGKLLNVLKKYFQHQWETQYAASNQWFIVFLKEYQIEEKHELYERILTRTALNGNKYMRDCPILSIVLQFLFEGIDDQCLEEDNVFIYLWLKITTEGIKSIADDSEESASNDKEISTKLSDYIVEDVLIEQTENKRSALFLAVRVYYEGLLSTLLKESKITLSNEVRNMAFDAVAEHGLSQGVQSFERKTTKSLYAKLLENVRHFQTKQKEKYLSEKHKIENISSSVDAGQKHKSDETASMPTNNQGN